MAQNPGSMHGHASFGFAHVSSNQAELYPCDDPSLVAQYMQHFPPLQPTTIQGVQPSTSGHEMVYPETPSHNHYLINQSDNTNTVGLDIQDSSFVSERNNEGGMRFSVKTESPGRTHRTSFPDRPPQYDLVQAHGHSPPLNDDCKQETERDMQTRLASGGDYPQPRPTAKRGKFVNLAEREATAYTRRIGSCIRCRMQRIRVSDPP